MSPIYSPGDVSKILGIRDSTLRKYSRSLEELGYSFQKNAQSQRWYNDKDVTVFRKVMSLKESDGITLQAAIEGAYLWVRGGEVSEAQTAVAVHESRPEISDAAVTELLAEMKEMIQAQGQQIEGLSYVITKQNIFINQQLRIEEPQPKSFFSRFFSKVKSNIE